MLSLFPRNRWGLRVSSLGSTSFTSRGLLGGEEAFSPSTEIEFICVVGASGFPAAVVRLVP